MTAVGDSKPDSTYGSFLEQVPVNVTRYPFADILAMNGSAPARINGTWTLVIFSDTDDTGTLHSWSLTFECKDANSLLTISRTTLTPHPHLSPPSR